MANNDHLAPRNAARNGTAHWPRWSRRLPPACTGC